MEAMKIDFTDVEGQQTFDPIPAGKYIVEVTDYREGTAKDTAKNPGAATVSWQLTVESLSNGDTHLTNREGKEIKVEGRTVWENMTLVENSFWRLKAFLAACGFDVEGEIDFNPDEVLNSRLVAKVAVQRGRKNPETGEEYDPRNQVKSWFSLDDEGVS
jgi:hypothetical protein